MAQGSRRKPGWDDSVGVAMSSPFAALGGRLAGSAAADAGEQPRGEGAPPAEPAHVATAPARAVVRYERKGRGGKSVTVVSHLGLSPQELERLCGEARRRLGCGGAVEGDALLLQGDQRERTVEWLRSLGVVRITLGA